MKRQHNRQEQHMPRDASGRHMKRSRAFLLGQLIISLTSSPLATSQAHAQSSTTCTGSSAGSCVDLYQGTISAIQAYGYQTPAMNTLASTTNGTKSYLQSFAGGVLNGGTMTFSESSGTPGEDVASSVWVYNCPTARRNAKGTVELTVAVSNSTTITSDSSVSNSSSSFNQGENTVSLSYTSPPSPYGKASASDVMSYTWGSTYDTSSTTSSSNTATNSSGESTTYPVSYDVPPGYSTTVSATVATNVYSGVNWSAPVTLTSPSNAPLANMQYIQQYVSTTPPNLTTTVNYNGSSVNANIWYAPITWPCQPNGQGGCSPGMLADPTGQYTYWPTQYATLGGWALTGAGTYDQIYWKGQSDGNAYQGANLVYSTSENDGSLFYLTNYTTGEVVLNPKVTQGGFVALLENGNLTAYSSSGTLLWSTDVGLGVKTPQTTTATPTPTPSELLGANTTALIASGTYSAISYDSQAQLGTGLNTPMTSAQISQYCSSGSSTSGTQPVSNNTLPASSTAGSVAMSPEIDAGYTLMKASFNGASQDRYVLAQNDDRRDRLEDRRFNNEERRSADRFNGVEAGEANRTPGQAIKKAVDHDNQNQKLGKLKYIKGPIVLRPNQYYTANLPGFKVVKVVVKSDNLTNYSGFAPGNSQLTSDTFSGEKRQVKLNLGNHMKTSVQPRKTF